MPGRRPATEPRGCDAALEDRLTTTLDTAFPSVIAYHAPGFAEPWDLVVPAESAALGSPAGLVGLNRQRMQIEHGFQDFKTHLGLRGLRLQVRIPKRMGRRLLAFCLAHALLLALGTTRAQNLLAVARMMLHMRPAPCGRCTDSSPASPVGGPSSWRASCVSPLRRDRRETEGGQAEKSA